MYAKRLCFKLLVSEVWFETSFEDNSPDFVPFMAFPPFAVSGTIELSSKRAIQLLAWGM
jgi:hypothetical protein